MTNYFKIGSNDYSPYVNMLKVAKQHNYKSMTTASGNTLVKYINSKRVIEVGFIPLDDATMKNILADLNNFTVSISFLDPETNTLSENVNCIVPNNIVEYYTIQVGKVMYKAFTIQIQEL